MSDPCRTRAARVSARSCSRCGVEPPAGGQVVVIGRPGYLRLHTCPRRARHARNADPAGVRGRRRPPRRDGLRGCSRGYPGSACPCRPHGWRWRGKAAGTSTLVCAARGPARRRAAGAGAGACACVATTTGTWPGSPGARTGASSRHRRQCACRTSSRPSRACARAVRLQPGGSRSGYADFDRFELVSRSPTVRATFR